MYIYLKYILTKYFLTKITDRSLSLSQTQGEREVS